MKDHFSRFYRDESGVMVGFSIFLFLIIMMIGGIGIDVMRFEGKRIKLQNTLDNAVLAAANLEQNLDPTYVVQDYFDKAGLSEFLDSVTVTGDDFHRQVNATVSADIPTFLMHMVGYEVLTANVQSAALERSPYTEISLVLDISGSMRANDRVSTMKEAAKSFTTKVLERNTNSMGESNPYLTSVNVIPFSGQTNPGPTMFEYLGGVRFGGVSSTQETNYFPEWRQDISNIVFRFDRDGDDVIDYSVKIEGYPDNDVEMFNKDDLDSYLSYAVEYIKSVDSNVSDGMVKMVGATIKGGKQPTSYYSTQEEGLGDPTSDEGPTKFNNVDKTIQFNEFYSGIVPNNTSSCIEMTSDDFTSTGLPSGSAEQTPYFVNWDYDEATQDWGWCPEDSMAIQYAQQDDTEINTFIDDLRLFDGTGTNYGMKYALALLDPNTQPAFAHLKDAGEVPSEFSDRPLAWDAVGASKYIVLMTDGRTGTQIRPTETLDLENSDTELTQRPAEESITDSHSWTNRQMFLYQCDLAKSKGVTIFTVAVETSSVAAEEVKECASSASHFFEVTGAELVDSFVSIASSIQNLRLIN